MAYSLSAYGVVISRLVTLWLKAMAYYQYVARVLPPNSIDDVDRRDNQPADAASY